jgi:type I restriction enzyme S subunit
MTGDKPSRLVPKLRFAEFRDAEDWEEEKLGNLVSIVSGESPSQYALFRQGDCPFVKVEDLNNCAKYQVDAREYCNDVRDVVPSGSILFPKRGAAIENNKIRITAANTLIDTNLMALTPHNTAATEFLYYYIVRVGLAHIADTSSIPQINNKHILPYRVLVPSESEQQKIVDCLGSLDDLIAAEGRKLEGLRQHKKGLMQQLFPQPGETVPRLRFPEFEDAPEWESKTLASLLTETERPIDMEDETEYALVTVKRRYGGVVAREVLKGRAIKVKSQFLVQTNDFLISKRQIVHNACGLVPLERNGSIVSNEYAVLTAKNGCDIKFFNYFAQQPCVSDSFLQSSVGIVIEKMLFKLDWWLKLTFPFPSFIEQQRIAACLSSLDARLTSQTQRLDSLKCHKQGLLQQLFPSLEEETR